MPSGSLFIASAAADDSLPNGFTGPVALTPDASAVVFVSNMEGLAAGGSPSEEDVFGGPSGIDDPRTRFFFPAASTEVIKEEGDSVIQLPVRRSGNLTVPVSIGYNTVDGTAAAGVDYDSVSGTLEFLAGEAGKTVAVTIHNPAGNEPARSFFLVLDDSPADFLFPIGNSHEVTLVAQFGLLQSIRRISEDASGTGGNQNSDFPSVDATGTLAVFSSNATNLVPGVTVTVDNLFLHDSTDGSLQLLALDPHVPGTETAATYPVISGDGDWVVFRSAAAGLTPEGNATSVYQVYLANLQTGAITLVSKSPADAPGNGSTNLYSSTSTTLDVRKHPFSVSQDGRFVAFHSSATNLIASDTNSDTDIFLYNRDADSLIRIDEAHTGVESIGESYNPSVSADGRYVAYVSQKPDLVPGDSNGFADVFRYDRITGTTVRVSVADDGSEADGPALNCSIAGDGNLVAFDGYASNLIGAGDTNGYPDCFVRDVASGSTTRVSVTSDGSQTVPFDFGYKLDGSSFGPAISADGRHVAFTSYAANLDPAVQFPPVSTVFLPNEKLYIHNRDSGETVALIPVNNADAYAETPLLSADGRVAALWSQSAVLIADDNNARYDAFLAPNPAHPAYDASGFALWQVLNFYHQAGDPAVGGPGADGEPDFITNIWEYLLGLDPNVVDAWPAGAFTHGFDHGTGELELSFLKDPAIGDVDWTVESSPSLTPPDWTAVPGGEVRLETTVEGAHDRIHLFLAPPAAGEEFYRLDLAPQSQM
jgi:Tol biopolymer transport system component